jgi:hypothetical protein
MRINIFDDPSKVPQPRNRIRIETLKATPYPDGRRVFVELVITAFQERPNILLVMFDAVGTLVNEASIIATMHASMEFTLHMRMPDPTGDYTLKAELFYETRNPPLDERTIAFRVETSQA